MVNDGGASNRNSLGSGGLGNECLAILRRLLQRLDTLGNVSSVHIAPLIYSKEVETENEKKKRKAFVISFGDLSYYGAKYIYRSFLVQKTQKYGLS